MRKILSLILCVSFVFACVPFSADSEMTSGRLPELIIASATPAEFVQKGDLFEVFGVLCEYGYDIPMNGVVPYYCTFIRLTSDVDTQEEIETVREVLLSHPDVIYADQNGVGSLDQKAYKLGDINNDKTHNFIDYLLLKRAFIGTYELTDVQRSAADINGDGRVGGVDYLMLKRSAMKYFNIKQPQTSPDEVELTDMAYGYYEYKKSLESFQWMPFEASDVTIIKSRVYGKYGDGNCYIVFGMITGYGYIDCEHEIEVGGRTIILRDCNEPLVWDGSAMHDIWTAYENGLIDDVDLEDFQARETLV